MMLIYSNGRWEIAVDENSMGDVDAGQWPAFPFARDVYQREGISCVRARRARRARKARKARKARRHQARCEARGKRQDERKREKEERAYGQGYETNRTVTTSERRRSHNLSAL